MQGCRYRSGEEGAGPSGAAGGGHAARQLGLNPLAASFSPANTLMVTSGSNRAAQGLWDFAAVGLDVGPCPEPGAVVRAFVALCGSICVPVRAGDVQLVRFEQLTPGGRARLRLPAALARALLSAKCRLGSTSPVTLDVWRGPEERLWCGECRAQGMQRALPGRADAAPTWRRAVPAAVAGTAHAAPAQVRPSQGWRTAPVPTTAAVPAATPAVTATPTTTMADTVAAAAPATTPAAAPARTAPAAAPAVAAVPASAPAAAAAPAAAPPPNAPACGPAAAAVAAPSAPGAPMPHDPSPSEAAPPPAPSQSLPSGWFAAECIVEERQRRWGNKSGRGVTVYYKVRYAGCGEEEDLWCKAADVSAPLVEAWRRRTAASTADPRTLPRVRPAGAALSASAAAPPAAPAAATTATPRGGQRRSSRVCDATLNGQ